MWEYSETYKTVENSDGIKAKECVLDIVKKKIRFKAVSIAPRDWRVSRRSCTLVRKAIRL